MSEPRTQPRYNAWLTGIAVNLAALGLSLAAYFALARCSAGTDPLGYQTVHVCIDEKSIASGDAWEVIDPVWWTANIYDGPEEYARTLDRFSRPQRLVFAVIWYRAEVNNGGHHQFYANSTGIVWKDALEAFRVLDVAEFAGILEESAQRLGGAPSLDRDERNEQLASSSPDFDDLDERFYQAEEQLDLDQRLIEFIRAQPAEFYFDGEISKPVLPGG